MMRVAVVGSGAAAVGALHALCSWCPDAEITVFDIGKELDTGPGTTKHPVEWTPEGYGRLYRQTKANQGARFPPPKTQFGQSLPRYLVDGRQRVFRSELLGGLTNYWGGGVLPFTEQDLLKWPVGIDTLRPYYKEIANLVGVSGRRDALNQYFMDDFSNRPPLQPIPTLAKLNEWVNSRKARGNYDVLAGVTRLTLETREGHGECCVYCGECMSGCFVGAIYTAKSTVSALIRGGRIKNYLKGKVVSVDPDNRSIALRSDQGDVTHRGFSKVFLCAGCVGTTEIVMRSLGIKDGLTMTDNAVYTFPIVYLGEIGADTRAHAYLALSNVTLGCVPRKAGLRFAQVNLYPNCDYLWRYYLPVRVWPYIQPIASTLRSRLFWARLYVHSVESQAYSLALDASGELVFSVAHDVGARAKVTEILRSIRSVVSGAGFYMPWIPPVRQETSAHYAASLPYGGEEVDVSPNGEVMRGVYICDSACFPDSPATPPTFTIMANACRTVMEAMND